ncbi:DNA polymerase III subunit delta [Pleionea sediminis]|uniref:DNA polymerase III subunit delta n=1 Tax=Pleionea sediminis TaxID=2569479 RepID=UPI0011871896|nr:DNA polymerase III subunit delta [Pleionea sediminis]
MPIKLEQLESALNKNPSAVLITGDEPLLSIEAEDTIRQSMRQRGFTERSVYEVARNFDFNQLFAKADNLSLFAERQLIELRLDKAPDKNQQQSINELISSAEDDTCYVVSCPKLDKRKLSAKWVKAFEERGCVVQIWPVATYQLPKWLGQRAQQMGLSLTPDALSMLADRSEGNLLAAKQDLEKLLLTSGGRTVDVTQVMDAVANNARYNTFELIDAALGGQLDKAARMLELLKQEGVVPVIIVSTVYREARQLMKMSEQVARGKSIADVIKEYRVWSSRSRLINQALSRVPFRVWAGLVTRCSHLDKLSKGQAEGNVWDEILTCLMLMGGKQLWRNIVKVPH